MPKIYTASFSFFQPDRHHGQAIAISRSLPKGFKADDRLSWLAPPSDLLDDWKTGGMSWDDYTARYRVHFAKVVDKLINWVDNLEGDATLLCWERAGEECHRNLVAKFIEKRYPDRFGGCDIPNGQPAPAVEKKTSKGAKGRSTSPSQASALPKPGDWVVYAGKTEGLIKQWGDRPMQIQDVPGVNPAFPICVDINGKGFQSVPVHNCRVVAAPKQEREKLLG